MWPGWKTTGALFNLGKPSGKSPLERARYRLDDYITTDLKEIGVNTSS